jgi:nucleotide-binding universal stress UspA family protein
MDKISILLALSGTKQSYTAAQMAWRLSDQLNASVTAQHVVDTYTAWSLLGNDVPGLIGSGPYVEAYDTTCVSLRSIGQKLALKYESMSGSQKIKSDCIVEEGDPVAEICRRAADHDLVIMGHRPARTNDRFHGMRSSIAEDLANHCPRPLMVIQDESKIWTKMKILVSAEHLNIGFIVAAIETAKMLRLSPEIECLSTGLHEQNPEHIIRDLREAYKVLCQVPLGVTVLGAGEHRALWSPNPVSFEVDASAETLLAIPTREVGGQRITIFGSAPSNFVRQLTLPTVLLCPEENLGRVRAADSLSAQGV